MGSVTYSGSLNHHYVSCVGKYVLYEPLEINVFKAAYLHSGKDLVCKVLHITRYWASLAAYFHLPAHANLKQPVDIVLADPVAYVFFNPSYGDMHSFVRSFKKLHEDEATRVFQQIVSVVAHCHDNGVVLKDIKLRRFVFQNEERTLLTLENLEDVHIMEQDDDSLSGKHGCPAYISPEALGGEGRYSGKAADVWSLGVVLYTILVGRYPFNDTKPSSLFSKIRLCKFSLPDSLSPKAKCLIRNILRWDPSERLTPREILDHPWFSSVTGAQNVGGSTCYKEPSDQMVPDSFC